MGEYLHESNKGKDFVDWRSPDKRMDAFLLWLDWRLKYYDLDHYGPNNAYRDADGDMSPTGNPMTKEQSMWFSLLFGMTYQSEMAWNIYWQFPNIDKIDLKEMQEWNLDTFKHQRYSRDTKYNKGHITNQTKSIIDEIESKGSLTNYFYSVIDNDQAKSFDRVYETIMEKFFKYGRMTSWLACQTMYETANVPIEPKDMLATDASNWSVRSGIMYLYNKNEWIEAKTKKKLTKDQMAFIAEKELEIYSIAKEYLNGKYPIFSPYLLESQLCQFKKLMLGGSTAHDYPGHSTQDHKSYVKRFSEKFPTNFAAFHKFSEENHHPILRDWAHDPKVLGDFTAQTGQLLNMHDDYDFLPNVYNDLGLKKTSFNDFTDKQIKGIIKNYKGNLYGETNSLHKFFN